MKLAGFRWVTPGAVFALVVWLLASVAFAFYAANFGSYDKTYGTLGGLVVFLVWMWITNVALLLGMELNAERERSRELIGGTPGAERELQLDARDAPKNPRRHDRRAGGGRDGWLTRWLTCWHWDGARDLVGDLRAIADAVGRVARIERMLSSLLQGDGAPAGP